MTSQNTLGDLQGWAAGVRYRVVLPAPRLIRHSLCATSSLRTKRDGKPLDAKESPLRIVAPGDNRAARWVRQVTVLRLIAEE